VRDTLAAGCFADRVKRPAAVRADSGVSGATDDSGTNGSRYRRRRWWRLVICGGKGPFGWVECGNTQTICHQTAATGGQFPGVGVRWMCARHDGRRPDADVLIAIECRTGIIRDKCKSRNIIALCIIFLNERFVQTFIVGNAQQLWPEETARSPCPPAVYIIPVFPI